MSNAPAEPPDPLLGRLFGGRYLIKEVIARGGMGKVYRAEQKSLSRPVALKVLSPNYHGEGDPEFHKRFLLEASTCAKLTHPNTVTIFDYGHEDGVYYIAMEYVEGPTLRQAIKDAGIIPIEAALRIARQISRALREAHSIGVIHRDLKPANVMLSHREEGENTVKILDFGLVKEVHALDSGAGLTKTGLFMGSPKYMAPEQIRNEDVDHRVDIYALGVVLYEMLVGRPPFIGRSEIDVLSAHLQKPVPTFGEVNPDVRIPLEIEAVVRKALQKDPDARFADMSEFLTALQAVSSDERFSYTPSGVVGQLTSSMLNELAATPSGVRGMRADEADIAVDVEPPRRGWLAIAVVLVVAIAGAAALLFALERRNILADHDERPAPRPPPTPREIEPPAEPAPAEQRISLMFRSEPEGAMVVVDNRAYGPTPAEVEWTGWMAEPGREVTFRFQMEGFRDMAVTRTIEGQRLEVEATLQPIAHRPPPRRDRRPDPESSMGGLNFRENPF